MSIGLRLSDYATTPLYNIKAVVQATGISPSTLRAWERRYNMCRPQRSESGYRLYAEREVAVIRWLKAQVDAGMSISQAVAWLDSLAAQSGGMDQVILPGSAATTPIGDLVGLPVSRREHVRDFDVLQDELLHALMNFREDQAEQIVAEAFAMYPVEQVGEKLFAPVLVEVGERWQRGTLSVTTEHFATNYLQQCLSALLRTMANRGVGPLIWVGCAPSELHEIGALLLSVYLRRAGYRVHYLGQSLSAAGLNGEAQRQQPAMILLSASTQASAEELARLAAQLTHNSHPSPPIGYGGQIFRSKPELRSTVAGIYLGDTAHHAVQQIDKLLLEHPHAENAEREAQP